MEQTSSIKEVLINTSLQELISFGYDNAANFISLVVEENASEDLLELVADLVTDDLFNDCTAEYFKYLYESKADIEWYKAISLLYEETFERNSQVFSSFFIDFKKFFESGFGLEKLDEIDKLNHSYDDFMVGIANLLLPDSVNNEVEMLENKPEMLVNEPEISVLNELEVEDSKYDEEKEIVNSGEANEFIEYLKADIEKLNNKLEKTAKENDELNSRYSAVLSDLKSIQDENSKLKDVINKNMISVKFLENKVNSNNRTIDKLGHINERLLSEAQSPGNDYKKENDNLKTELQNKDLLINSLQAQLDTLNKLVSKLESDSGLNDFNDSISTEPENDYLDNDILISGSSIENEVNSVIERDYEDEEVIHIDIPGLVEKGKGIISKFTEFIGRIHDNRFLKNNEQEQYSLIMGKLANDGYSGDVFTAVKNYLRGNPNASKVELYNMLLKRASGDEILDFCNEIAS